MASAELPALGVGIVYSTAIETLLEREPELFQVLEVEPQTTWIMTPGSLQPYRASREILEHLGRLPGHKIVHSVGTPVGGTQRPEPAQLAQLRETVIQLESPWVSDHLSFNQTSEFATGFFLPPHQTKGGVETAVASIQVLKSALPVPVAVETGVNYLRPRPDELPDGDFVRRVVEGADCGLLLDLHNVFCNGRNGRQPLEEYVEQLPLSRVWEMHLAGGMERDGFWLDAHSGAIPDPLYALAERLVPRLPNLKAIVFEIFPSFVPIVGLELIRAQIERLHELWRLRVQRNLRASEPLRTRNEPVMIDTVPPAAWERALGRLVIGCPADDELSQELEPDPGVALVRGLIHEFSASMIVGTLRLTTRLLMLTMGPEPFRVLLDHYWSKHSPQMYAALEAKAFARYLATIDLRVPHLGKVLELEGAAIETLIDGKVRVVQFDFEPLPLLRALAEGQLPNEPGEPGIFEIELTAENLTTASGLDLETVERGNAH